MDKKGVATTVTVVLIIVFLAIGFGIGYLVKAPPVAPKVYRVAFSPNNLGFPFWRTCLAGAAKAVEDINAHFGKEVVYMNVMEYLDDPDKQASHIDMAIAAGYDWYTAPALEESPTVGPLRRLHDAGIPAILWDRDTAEAGRLYRICCIITSNVDAGALEVSKLVEALEASGKPTPWKVAGCWGHPGASSAEDRRTGSLTALEALEAVGKVTIVGHKYHTLWSREGAMTDVETWLAAHPDLAAVVCSNDDMAMGAIAGIKATGKTPGVDVFVAGVDAIEEACAAVAAGEMVVTLAQANYAMAYWSILGGLAHVAMGWKPPADVIVAPLTPVTAANVAVFTLENAKLDVWAAYGPTIERLVLP